MVLRNRRQRVSQSNSKQAGKQSPVLTRLGRDALDHLFHGACLRSSLPLEHLPEPGLKKIRAAESGG